MSYMYLFIYYDKYIKFSDIAEKYKTREGRLSNIFFQRLKASLTCLYSLRKVRNLSFRKLNYPVQSILNLGKIASNIVLRIRLLHTVNERKSAQST